jgi:hypothetical protein
LRNSIAAHVTSTGNDTELRVKDCFEMIVINSMLVKAEKNMNSIEVDCYRNVESSILRYINYYKFLGQRKYNQITLDLTVAILCLNASRTTSLSTSLSQSSTLLCLA